MWERRLGEGFGEAVARIAREVTEPGIMGAYVRRDVYKPFVSCGFEPALAAPFQTGDISTIRTSCAVFARACLHWAGRKATRPGKVGQGIFNGWLEGLSNHGAAFRPGTPCKLPVGAVVYRDYGRLTAGGHVQVIVEALPDGRYITAEGGGSPTTAEGDAIVKELQSQGFSLEQATDLLKKTNGTVCRLGKAKDVWEKDSMGRVPFCWWDPAELDPEAGATIPAPSGPSPSIGSVSFGDKGPAVGAYQKALLAKGYKLPRFGADNDYGLETLKATESAQRDFAGSGAEPSQAFLDWLRGGD